MFAGVRLIVSLPLYWPPLVYTRPPFTFVHCPTIDSPLTPIPIFMLRRGVRAALPVIEHGGAVLIHCKAGVHRSVAMATCILIAHGQRRRGTEHPLHRLAAIHAREIVGQAHLRCFLS